MLEPAAAKPLSSRSAAAAWPPPPHDPRERVVGVRVDGWEVRVFAPTDPKRTYLAARGFAHLQLWHPGARASILTPSRLTGGHFEIFPIEGWKYPVADAGAARDIVQQVFHLTLPRPARLAGLLEWFVRATERALAGPPAHRAAVAPRRRRSEKSADSS